MAVISGICFFLFGPFLSIIRINSINNSVNNMGAYFLEHNKLNRVLEVLDLSIIFYNSVSVLLALVFGILAFRYLHQKKEVDFYHSQPIHRTKLFITTYLAGLAALYMPMMVMYFLNLAIVAIFGYGAVISAIAVAAHLGYMILFSLASYSLAVFAGQLTGTTATHTAMTALLCFIVPITAMVWSLAMQLFRATAAYSYEGEFLANSFKFSPVAAMLRTHFIGLPTFPVPFGKIKMTFVLPEFSTLLIQIISILVFTLVAWKLYSLRKSEACGSAMVYGFTEPVLKGYVMFLAGFGVASIILSFSTKTFFYLTFFLFAILAHMVCEVILRKDFKAMLGHKKECGALLLVLLILLMCLRFDVTGFDRYVPEESQVNDIHITAFNGWYNYGTGIFNNTEVGITDPETKHLTLNLIQAVVDKQCYQKSRFENHALVEGDNYYSNITVSYHMNNGKTIYRNYRNVPLSKVREEYLALSNDENYRDYVYREVLSADPGYLETLEINDLSKNRYRMIYSKNDVPAEVATETGVDSKPVQSNFSTFDQQGYATAVAILKAYQQDLQDRTGDALLQESNWTPEYEMQLFFRVEEMGGSGKIDYFSVPVFPCDTRTITLLKNIQF